MLSTREPHAESHHNDQERNIHQNVKSQYTFDNVTSEGGYVSRGIGSGMGSRPGVVTPKSLKKQLDKEAKMLDDYI